MRGLRAAMVVLGLLAAGPALGQGGGMGPLEGLLPRGTDGLWTGRFEDGAYVLENLQPPGPGRDGARETAVQYAYTESGEAGRRDIRVRVRLDVGGPTAQAGLLYALRREPLSYYALVVEDGPAAVLYRRDGRGMSRLLEAGGDPIRMGWNELRLVERGAGLEAIVNGRRIAALEPEGAGGGAVGIFARGAGRYRFADFSVGKVPVETAQAGSTGGDPGSAAGGGSGDPAGMGPLGPFLLLGADERGWEGRMAGGTYVLDNSGYPDAVKILPASAGKPGRRDLSVTVDVRSDGTGSAAGLLYGLVEAPLSYHAYVLHGDGRVELLRRGPDGFETVLALEGRRVREGANRLRIVEDGQRVELHLNGERIETLAEAGGRGDVGIVAMGPGRFDFGGFSVASR